MNSAIPNGSILAKKAEKKLLNGVNNQHLVDFTDKKEEPKKLTRSVVEGQEMDKKDFDIDKVITQLLSVQNKKPGTYVNLELETI